ncbi:four helix bundle protein [Gangjinia marincola]|uniref:Four helix bundle protein n=1 Tax=Gangjinia marincola TaxID=578463 RepID=A0ABN1MF75_9FLAO
MAKITKFEELEVWQRSRKLSSQVHELIISTKILSNFRLRDQMEGSSGSIMDNIAEGFDRDGNKEFHNFLSYAKGSAGELKSQLYRSLDKGYITNENFESLSQECETIKNKIGALMFYLRKSDYKGIKFK